MLYPELESHPQHQIHKKQSSGMSGMLSFYLKGGREESTVFLSSLKVRTKRSKFSHFLLFLSDIHIGWIAWRRWIISGIAISDDTCVCVSWTSKRVGHHGQSHSAVCRLWRQCVCNYFNWNCWKNLFRSRLDRRHRSSFGCCDKCQK